MTPPVARIEWRPCWRIIPSRFPPIDLFQRVTAPDDLEAVFALDAMTNPRLRDDAGDIRLVPPEERISGPGSSVVMAAFTHLNAEGSRFTDGSYGAFYAASDLETAIAETKHHRERFMRATAQARMELDMRVYLVDLAGDMHDLRSLEPVFPLVYCKDDYTASRHLASTLRKEGSSGIAYDSVRRKGGECVAAFQPSVLSAIRQERHLCYVWNGRQITDIYEKRDLKR